MIFLIVLARLMACLPAPFYINLSDGIQHTLVLSSHLLSLCPLFACLYFILELKLIVRLTGPRIVEMSATMLILTTPQNREGLDVVLCPRVCQLLASHLSCHILDLRRCIAQSGKRPIILQLYETQPTHSTM